MVLGLESSCDETGAGIVRDGRLLAHVVASSMDEHARFGGVVPEIAARAHLHAFNPVVRQALDQAGLRMSQLDAIAVTTGPGLSGALQVGLAGAKTLAYALDLPLYGVHHLAGHVAADTLEHGPLPEPCMVLIVSGGHTSLLLVRDLVREPILHLGDTLDDAAGECFDKVARVLGLPYPGGPPSTGPPGTAIRRPSPSPPAHRRAPRRRPVRLLLLLLRAQDRRCPLGRGPPAARRGAAGRRRRGLLQEAVADVLTRKAVAACKEYGVRTLVVVGGVAANSRVRDLAERRCASAGIELRVPPMTLCTDNGAMIAAIGDLLVRSGTEPAPYELTIDPSAPLEYAALNPRAAVEPA